VQNSVFEEFERQFIFFKCWNGFRVSIMLFFFGLKTPDLQKVSVIIIIVFIETPNLCQALIEAEDNCNREDQQQKEQCYWKITTNFRSR